VDVVAGDAVIQASGLVKRYGELEAVRGIDLEVRAGEIFGFLGPNGAGKSTTISILCTLLSPTSGKREAERGDGAHARYGAGFRTLLGRRRAWVVDEVAAGLPGRADPA
jgi:ABC-type branched-subunit amino acid transport system ATPase component